MSVNKGDVERTFQSRKRIVILRHDAAVVDRHRVSSRRTGRVGVVDPLSGAFCIITCP